MTTRRAPAAGSASLEAALAFLRTFIDFEQMLPDASLARTTFDLGRTRRLLSLLGDPHLGRPQVHVTGTKGKGSVAFFADAILRAHGVRTFRFTSPHVERLNERIAIGGEDVADDRFAATALALRPAAGEMAADPPTFFEAMTAIGFAVARGERVDADVVEVGLGGRLDATNVVEPSICVITSIGLDHTKILGRTREKIAAEKAGIIKPRTPVLTGLGPGDAGFDVIASRARELDAPLLHRGGGLEVADVRFALDAGGRPGVRFRGAIGGLRVEDAFAPCGGIPQAVNALLAIGAARRVLEAAGRKPGLACALDAIAATSMPARAERFGTRVPVLLDGAHTGDSCAALAALAEFAFAGRPLVLIGGLTQERSVRALFSPFRKLTRHAVFAPIPSPRTADPAEAAAAWRALGGKGEAARSPADALERALAAANGGGAIVVAGSFYLAGAVRPLLRGLE